MTHGDDSGLILPPAVAPYQVVIVPIPRGNWKETVLPKCEEIRDQLKAAGIRVKLDADDSRRRAGSSRSTRCAASRCGSRSGRRTSRRRRCFRRGATPARRRRSRWTACRTPSRALLDEIQDILLARARRSARATPRRPTSYDEFKPIMEGRPGFVLVALVRDGPVRGRHQGRDAGDAAQHPVGLRAAAGQACIKCDEPATVTAWFAKAY